MHDPFQWSIGLGRWGGLTIRLHVLFLAFAGATLYLFWPEEVSGPQREASSYLMAAGQMLGTAAAAIAVLFLSVLAHELSHWWAARRAGTAPDTIVIGPLGGLTQWPSAASPHQELAIWSAGPLANLCFWAMLATLVMVCNPDHSWAGLFNPLQPGGLALGTSRVMQLVAIASWINSLLFLVNSLPGYPFDGGRMLRSALLVVRPAMDERRVAALNFWVSITVSIVFAAIALILWKHGVDGPDSLSQAPLALLLLSVVLLVNARQEMETREITRTADEPEEFVADRPNHADFRASFPVDSEWESEEQIAAEDERQEEIEAADEKLVDGILSRLHAHGMNSLTTEERALLQRVSARYRHRLGRRT